MADLINYPKITVITPCLNSGKTLQRAIDSLKLQNYLNLEFIIIDGRSTDNTIEIIKNNINIVNKWISEPDNGTTDAINKGLTMASGELIGILLSDDTYEANSLLKIGKMYLSFPETDVFYGNLKYISQIRSPKVWIANSKISKKSFVYPSGHIFLVASFIKHSCLRRYGLFSPDYDLANDYEMFLRLINSGARFQYINHIIATMTSGGRSDDIKNARRMDQEIRKAFYSYEPSELSKLIFEIVFCINIIKRNLVHNSFFMPFLYIYRSVRHYLFDV